MEVKRAVKTLINEFEKTDRNFRRYSNEASILLVRSGHIQLGFAQEEQQEATLASVASIAEPSRLVIN